ncbi:Ger(x)C family spore germination protein [Paenibacillus sp. BSR1-1]|uniref:Ger(x)C family spore germination protein n=1 Tax=Paenibacillus sp. BSR1-1 TaxID=3020845 RepID=UPI0025AFAE96|nr:Ger(x)C family spore germination protein [Paenibacillus sp. BSR1-1]MDN3016285.1 Ger(x)C family spore germination protein [Paenibacillus sp. BSR1-1]
MMIGKRFFIFIVMLALTGCWDEKLLKDSSLVLSIGIDLAKNNEVKTTTAIRTSRIISGGQSESINYIVEEISNTIRETRLEVDKQIPGVYEQNKLRILLIGDKIASKDLYPYFDVFFRDPRSSLAAKVAVVKGEASEIIKMKKLKENLISEALIDLLKSAEEHTIVPVENQQTILTSMFDVGEDFTLPYMEKLDKDTVKVTGVALFHRRSFTGKTLKGNKPIIFLMAKGEKSKDIKLTERLENKDGRNVKNFVSFSVLKTKRNMNIKMVKGKPAATINLKLFIEINEYPEGSLYGQKEESALNKKVARRIEKEANAMVDTLKSANCDAFGIGRYLIADHHKEWEKLNWDKEYPDMAFKINVKVETVNRGIIQ